MQEVPAALVERFDLQAPWEVQAAQEEALPQGFVYLDEAAPGMGRPVRHRGQLYRPGGPRL